METTVPAPRVSMRHKIECRKVYAREIHESQIVNLSVTGAFIAPLEGYEPGDELHLNIQVSGRERKVTAQVVWCGRGGCGVKFVIRNGQDQQIVDDLVSFADEYRSRSRGIFEEILKKI